MIEDRAEFLCAGASVSWWTTVFIRKAGEEGQEVEVTPESTVGEITTVAIVPVSPPSAP